MTAEEAKKMLERMTYPSVFPNFTLEDDVKEMINTAIEALEKQVPKKPLVPVDTWLCPSCGESVEYQQKLGDNVLYHGQHDFCPKCGQRILWEGVEG